MGTATTINEATKRVARITGTQSIPSALLDGYRANLAEARPDSAVVGKRYPYRVPTQQDGGRPSLKKRQQRARFKSSLALFKTVTAPTRGRWYDAMPVWGSFLWYYDYFIMSDLTGNADGKHGGCGVIKSIQFKTIAMPSGSGEGSVAITAIDPAKSVVMLYGNSIAVDDEGGVYFVTTVYPYVSEIGAEIVKCKWSLPAPYYTNTKAADIGITVIEYI